MSVISIFPHKVPPVGKTVPGIKVVGVGGGGGGGGSTKTVRKKAGKREGESLCRNVRLPALLPSAFFLPFFALFSSLQNT